MVVFLWGASLVCLYIYLERRKRNRIAQLLSSVEGMNRGRYRAEMAQDDFSILEDEILKLFIEAVEAREETQGLAKRQAQNVEDIAHQIKTPIAGILLQLERRGNADESEGLYRQLLRLNTLADDLLKLASLDAGGGMMRAPFPLAEAAAYAKEIVEDMLDARHIACAIDMGEEVVVGDFYWISEALINLLKNAAFQTGCSRIAITSASNPLYTSIAVEDDGGGIPAAERKKIFRRFYKSPDSDGFGLGLAMAKKIAEENGGELEVEEGAAGARFVMKFYRVTEKSS